MSDNELDDIPANTNHDSTLENDLPTVRIISFGHRRGPLIPEPHLSIDLRNLPNPPKAIRNGQTGLTKPIRDWVFNDAAVQTRFQSVCRQVQECLNTAQENEETEVIIGVNCEIGKHRSVAFTEELGRVKFESWNVIIEHRDVHIKRSSQKHRSRRDHDNEDDD
ncbi:hypothetical protein CPB83DRAFT_854246 [Crepidotus variabilis]|uniref:RapZ C-terminal domain-containing protein n=1 Tax=Crepidotus variabilis TaxID=179855 RepID=A0A9P6EG88_9AGAR|nr:hypothetical protein CPB83DRAFT_854246 [Crepidotus variabilis]